MGEGLKFDQKLDSALPDGLIKNLNERISTMKEAELRDRLEDARIAPKRTVPELRKQLLAVMLKEAQETPSLEKSVDVENTEPEINDEMEEKLEAEIPTSVLRVVPKDDIVEVPKTETSEEVQARVDKAKASIEARLRERERQEEIERLSPEPFKETAYSSGAELAGGRRIAYRNVDSFPFGKPKRTIEPGNKVVGYEKPDLKILQKNEPIVLPERQKLLHKDDLGKTKEVKIPEKDRVIIEAIVTGQDILEKDKDYFDADKERLIMEALRKIGEVKKLNLHEDEKEEDLEKPGANPDHIFDDVKEPEVKQEKPVLNQERSIKEAPKEARDGNIDGLVEFNLNKLGINKTELVREMPNFFTLSVPQQNYVLEKLRQKTKHDLDENIDSERKKVKGLKRLVWGFRAGNVRKELAKETKEKGLASYKENFKDIISFVETRGLDVEMTEKGMVLKFITREGENDKHQKMIEEFNRKATVLAEIPYNKTLDDRTPLQILQKKKYEKALKEYEEVRSKLLGYESKNAGEQVNAKALEFSNIDDDIRMNQALTYNPEATSWVGKQIQKYGDKGIVLGAGFAVRGMAKYAAGFGGGLVASGVLGGVMGRLRKGKEFQTIANDKRYADKSDSTEKRAGVKEFIDSRGYAEKINKLVEQIEKTSNPDKREALIQSLNNRIMVARERDEAGLVRFGRSKDELKNKFAFIDSMKSAQRVILESDPKFLQESEKVAERLNNIFFKDEKKAEERKEEMKKAFWKGVRNSAGLFILGFEANDWAFHDGEATKALIDKMEKYGAEMNKVFADIGENVRDSISPVSDQNIIGAGKKLVGDFQNELNKAGFFANRNLSPETVRMNPTSETLVPGVNEAVSESTSVKLRPDLESLTSEKEYSLVNFPKNMPRPDSLPYDTNNLPEMPRTTVVAEASFGTRGAIGMIKDLQKSLWDQYGGKIPENLRAFAEGDPNKIAIGWGMYRPQDEFESIVLPKGTSLVAGNDGQVYLKGLDGNLVNMTKGGAGIEADFYDTKTGRINTGTTGDVLENKNPNTVENRLDGTPRTSERIDLENQQVIENPDMEQNAPNRSVYTENGFQGFEDYKDVSVEQGWTHTPSETGGDILSYEYEEPKPDQVVEGYSEIDGLKVETKELKGTIDFLYDSRGGIKGIDLPALQAEDVSRFRANPENFIGGSHDAAERAMLGKKLMAMNSQVETFLKYRRIMEVQSLHPDSPEYKFLHEESNKLWTAIQKKVDYQFNPEYTGFKPNPIENTVPVVEVPKEQPIDLSDNSSAPSSNERPPFVRNLSEDNIATEADLEHEKELVEAHRLEVEKGAAFEIEGNKTYAKAIEKYGEVSEIKGNIIIFEKGYVGFYGESMDEATALKKGEALARANSSIVGAQQDHIGIKQNGVNRIMYIFKKR